MDFLRSFFLNEALISSAFLSSKLDSPVIKTLERHSLNVKKCLSNVLITGESTLTVNPNTTGGPYMKTSNLRFPNTYER